MLKATARKNVERLENILEFLFWACHALRFV